MAKVVTIFVVLLAAAPVLAAPQNEDLGVKLRRMLQAQPTTKWADGRQTLTRDEREFIVNNQPDAGDVLLGIIAHPDDRQHRAAVDAFVATWDSMTPSQVQRYVEASLVPVVHLREKYPRGVEGAIGCGYEFRYGSEGRPESKKLAFTTTTTHFVDGKPYGKPFQYRSASSGCTTGWVWAGRLAVGPHKVSLVIDFIAGEGANTATGKVTSGDCTFEVLPEDTPDDLVAKSDEALDKKVRQSLAFAETEDELNPVMNFNGRFDWPPVDPWRPQITWKERDGSPNGLHCPVVMLHEPLPVDLCFDVTLKLEQSGEEFKADPVIVPKGSERWRSYIDPRDTFALCKGRKDFVPVRITLKASRARALSDLRVSSYWPGEITTGVLRFKIGPEKPREQERVFTPATRPGG